MVSRALRTVAASLLLLALVACDSGEIPGAPTVAPVVTPSTHRAANAYLLRPDQLPGYKRGGAQNVQPGTLADQENLPALKAEVVRQGFDSGARERFVDPGRATPRPFYTVFSQALFFHDEAGARAFFTAETMRRQVRPQSGTLTPLTGLPDGGAEQLLALQVDAPGTATTGGPQRAFLALMRRSNLVVTLFGQGDPAMATVNSFEAILVAQEKQLQQPL